MPDLEPLRHAQISRQIEEDLSRLSYEQLCALRDRLDRGNPPTLKERESVTGRKGRRSGAEGKTNRQHLVPYR